MTNIKICTKKCPTLPEYNVDKTRSTTFSFPKDAYLYFDVSIWVFILVQVHIAGFLAISQKCSPPWFRQISPNYGSLQTQTEPINKLSKSCFVWGLFGMQLSLASSLPLLCISDRFVKSLCLFITNISKFRKILLATVRTWSHFLPSLSIDSLRRLYRGGYLYMNDYVGLYAFMMAWITSK